MSMSLPENLPVGFRFSLKEEEALSHYLRLKMIGKDSDVDYVIPEVDFCSCDPWELPSKSKIKSDDQVWWFFSRRDYKNPSSKRAKRTAKSGFWKITSAEREIKDPVTKACIGTRKILAFLTGHGPGRKTNWIMYEYYPPHLDDDLPHQRDFVICRLENRRNEKANTRGCDDGEPSDNIISVSDIENPVKNKSDEKAGTPGCDEGESSDDIISLSDIENPVDNKSDEKAGTPGCDGGESCDDIISLSDIENPVASAAIFEVRGHLEGNADSLLQPIFSPDCYLTMEGISFTFEHGFNDGQNVNYEHHPEPESALPGPPGCNDGEPRGDIPSDIGNPLAHAAILEVDGHADSLSEVPLSPDCYLTAEDISLIFNDDQNFQFMHEYHPRTENFLPHQDSYLHYCLENITDGKAGTPGCNIGEPSSTITYDVENQVAPTAIPGVHVYKEVNAESLSQPLLSPDCNPTQKDINLNFSNSFNYDHNKWHALCGADKQEESPAEFLDGLTFAPYKNYHGETTNNLVNGSVQQMSLKRPYFLDVLDSDDMNVEGVDGRIKRYRSLALGE